MSTSEEKIKAFFSDEEKVKKLMSDEEFIEKVSGGTATTEIYTEEFKKLGLELSNDECEKVKEAVSKILDTPIETLEVDRLKNVSGGFSTGVDKALVRGGLVTSGIGCVGALACGIARSVYQSKANTAEREGDIKNANKYADILDKLDVSAKALLATILVGGGASTIGLCDQIRKPS